jgi:hypothetical protein
VLFSPDIDVLAEPLAAYFRQIIVSIDRNAISLVWNTTANFCDCLGQIDLKMFKEQRSATPSEDNSQWHASETLDIRAIIQECSELPPDVTRAELTRVDERIIDRRLLSFLASQSAPEHHDPGSLVRQSFRKDVLSPYLGRVLICVFIRLPGIHYTIEVDPELQRVVHWEWQDASPNRRTNT